MVVISNNPPFLTVDYSFLHKIQKPELARVGWRLNGLDTALTGTKIGT
jgi:hypothetical protein